MTDSHCISEDLLGSSRRRIDVELVLRQEMFYGTITLESTENEQYDLEDSLMLFFFRLFCLYSRSKLIS